MEKLNLVSGIEVGFGGVWIGAAPYLLFIPDQGRRRQARRPAADPPRRLGLQDTHETLNTFTWGPDGWLYGCHGVFTHSKVGKPGTPDKDRVPINAGIWRYHPTKHVFEVFAHGTSNPWGLDFDEHGQAFVEACVIPHLYHIDPGRPLRAAGRAALQPVHLRRHQDDRRPPPLRRRQPATRRQRAAPTARRRRPRPLRRDDLPGRRLAGRVSRPMFMGNIHGPRLNMDILKPKGSGFVASHAPDFLLANDSWSQFINLKYGPDGNVYLIDWYDGQQCHDNDAGPAGPVQRADFQGQLRAREAGAGGPRAR